MKIHAGKADPSATYLDTSGITHTIRRAFASAGLDMKSGMVEGIMSTIDRSLAAAGLAQADAPPSAGATYEGTAHEVEPSVPLSVPLPAPVADDAATTAPGSARATAQPGRSVAGEFTCEAGTRSFKVYVPASYDDASRGPLPLVIMLHGCTQSPDDFAAGTRMNELADREGLIVVYPAQSAGANGSKCWNWFEAANQARDRGEPAIIAGIAREVAASYGADPRRIFVAGLSAGAAMAVILGATYPDVFAAVGAHSGLPYGAAHDLPSAFGAMRGGASAATSGHVPTIVFHGDADRTVRASNGDAIVMQSVGSHAESATLRRDVQSGVAAGGTRYERKAFLDGADRVVAEHWVVRGIAHAWSGGSAQGSYTDARGPDASAEMVRFFLSQPRPGTA